MLLKLFHIATIYILFDLCLFRHIFVISTEPSNNYGEFILHLNRLDLCKGPKRIDCCDVSARVENQADILYNISIKKDVVPTRGKVVATVNGKPLLRLQMKKPCDHLFMKPLFQSILNVTDDCVFSRGDYKLKINLESVAQKYYKGMFIYGNLTFKALFYNEECNFSCTVVQVELSPIKNKTNTSP